MSVPVLLTVREVAAKLKVSTRTVSRMVATGILPEPIKATSQFVRWREESITAFVEQHDPALRKKGRGRAK